MTNSLKKGRKLLSSLAALFLISLLLYFVLIKPQQQYYSKHAVNIHGIYFLKPVPVSHFSLEDHHAKQFTEDNLHNHWSLLFFGFTRCPRVCPVTLSALNQMYQILQKKLPENELPHVVFITIDPENDTIAQLNQYINNFNSHFLGARTSIQETQTLEKLFYVTATKIPEGKKYSFSHSTEIILVNPKAQIQAYFSYPPKPEQIAADYEAILRIESS